MVGAKAIIFWDYTQSFGCQDVPKKLLGLLQHLIWKISQVIESQMALLPMAEVAMAADVKYMNFSSSKKSGKNSKIFLPIISGAWNGLIFEEERYC